MMLDWHEIREILTKYDLSQTHAVASPDEGMILGNADMGGVIFGPAHKLCFRVGKMDLLDARWNTEHYNKPLPLSAFKAFVFRESEKLAPGESIEMNPDDAWQGKGTTYPCMRMGADFLVRVSQSVAGLKTAMTQRISLADGLYNAGFNIGWWQEGYGITCRAFISWQHNVLAVKLSIPEGCRNRAVVSMWRDPWGGRSWELLSAGQSINGVKDEDMDYRRDPRVGILPPAELTVKQNAASLWQVIPGDEYCPERGFSVVSTCPEEGVEFFIEPSGQAVVEALERDELTFFTAIASEMEGPDSMGRATALSRSAAEKGWDRLYEEHAEAWQAFWMKSFVDLEDEKLERTWVLGNHKLAVNARGGRPAPGLQGVGIPHDYPPWRGDRHNNYPEYARRFWGAFAANREEQLMNYTAFVYHYLPTARKIAREIYECEEGAVYPHCYIDGSEQYWFHFTWARSLFLTALHVQNSWWHYQYFRDEELLRKMVYPVMRECAGFYVGLIEKNPAGDYTFWPTIATEIRGWTKDFEFNKNCIEDLAHIKFLMRAVIEASIILGTDDDKRGAWQDILDNLPEYPTLVVDGKEEFTDFAGQKTRPAYNHSVPMAVCWPAEDPDVYTDPRLRRILLNTLDAHPWEPARLHSAYLRLGLHDRLWQDVHKRVDDFILNEMLLTSWDGTIRLFPAWPLEKKARFRDLRTRGAFLVSAACENGRVFDVSVKSEKGGLIRMAPPWPKIRVINEDTGDPIETTRSGDVVQWDTVPGRTFTLTGEFDEAD